VRSALPLAPVFAALAFFAGCASIPRLPGAGPDIGIVEDENLRAFLRSLELIADAGCTLTVAGRHWTARCRVFRGPADEGGALVDEADRIRVAVAYDLVTDRPIVALLLHKDGRQEILWRPARQTKTGDPEVNL
jgi:hypothetical protein